MSNRVEDLESRVAELQAAVDGLTEELVETRERLRALEEGTGDDRNETVTPADGEESTDADDAPATPADEAAEDADHSAEPPTEADSGDATEEASSDSNSDSDDIIVA